MSIGTLAARGAAFDYESFLGSLENLASRPPVDAIVLGSVVDLGSSHDGLLLPAIRRAMPGLQHFAVAFGPPGIGRAFPRGMPWSAYPVAPAPSWRRSSGILPLQMHSGAEVTSHTYGDNVALIEALLSARCMVFVRYGEGIANWRMQSAECDYRFARWLENLPAKAVDRLRLIVVTPGSWEIREFRDRDEAVVAMQAAWAPTERLVYQYQVNALAVLGAVWREACRRTGTPEATPLPGEIWHEPLALQVLYRIAAGAEETALDGDLFFWTGTGRHPAISMTHSRNWDYVVQRLRANGLVARTSVAGRGLAPTGFGRAFLDVLHPDCRDPDILLRWRDHETGLIRPGHERAIDNWTRRYWGKIKNRLDRMPRPGEGIS